MHAAAAAAMDAEAANLLRRSAPSSSADENDASKTRSSVDDAGLAGTDKRSMGIIAVAFVIFGSVAGGPYGIEPAVGAAGALPTLIATLALAVMWSWTQALVSAEMSTLFPSNAGYITWVLHGLGPVPGFVNAANSVLSAVLNLPIYPVALAQYAAAAFPSLSVTALWGIKLATVAFVVLLNVAGIQAVSTAAIVLSVLVQTPFIVMPIAAAVLQGGGAAFSWSGALTVLPGWQSQLSVFVSTMCWNSIGWAYVGNLASEVRNPRVSFPIGASLAVLLSVANYFIPVLLCTALSPDATQWDTGYFATVGGNIAGWVGVWAVLGAFCSFLNNFQPQVGTTGRALRFMALYRMLPIPYLSRNYARFNTPVPAIILQAIVICVLMNFSFDTLVILNVLFYDVGVALQFAAYLRLKYTARHVPRPYETPGGIPGAWIITCLSYLTLVAGFYAAATTSLWALAIAAVCNVVFVLAGFVWARYGYSASLIDDIDAAESAGIDASDAVALDKARRAGLLATVHVHAPPAGGKEDTDDVSSASSSAGTSLLSADYGGTPPAITAVVMQQLLQPSINR